jgi:hypothetical protein
VSGYAAFVNMHSFELRTSRALLTIGTVQTKICSPQIPNAVVRRIQISMVYDEVWPDIVSHRPSGAMC